MKAICVTPERALTVRDVPEPGDPPAGHVVIRMEACAINPGDEHFLRATAPRAFPRSLHDVWGASGAGTVSAVGEGVSTDVVGRRVAVYRSLASSEHTVGTWSERALLPWRCCALVPEGRDALAYSGSLVNVITAYAFAKEAQADGHRGVVVTAGTSASGMALVGIARALGLPTVAIVRGDASRRRLRELSADVIVAASDATFDDDVRDAVERAAATAVFDGVGGALLGRLVPLLAPRSTVYSYGYLGGHGVPLQLPTAMLVARSLTLRGFSNFASPTVREPQALDAALAHVGALLALPHCQTPVGRTFPFEQIDEAMATLGTGAKPVLVPG